MIRCYALDYTKLSVAKRVSQRREETDRVGISRDKGRKKRYYIFIIDLTEMGVQGTALTYCCVTYIFWLRF